MNEIKKILIKWSPAGVFPVLVWIVGWVDPAWVRMWSIAFALYLACKVFTLRDLPEDARTGETWLYFLAWPGMNPRAFLREGPRGEADAVLPVLALRNMGIGIVCLWVLAPRHLERQPLLAGWLGMTGLIFLLHFGVFHGLAWIWQRRGLGAEALMNRPLEACGVSEFWGRRWNRAFQWLTWRYVFLSFTTSFSPCSPPGGSFQLWGPPHECKI